MDENPTPPGQAGAAGDAGTGEGSNRFAKAREYMGQKYETASGAMRDKYNTVREKVEDVDFGAVADQVRNYVRSNPGKALLISVGVGFLIGLLLRRDDED